LRPELDLKVTYTLGASKARLIRREVGAHGGGLRTP
jgi:hypothetical protein